MATYNFKFTNNNDGQTFVVNDLLDVSKNPIFNAPLNHDDTSPAIPCWVGDNEKGNVSIKGTNGNLETYDIDHEGQVVDYS